MAAVHVRHAAAGHPQTPAAAHPHLERELEVLAAPDPEAGVVPAELLEPGAVYGEQSSCVSWRVVRFTVVTALLLFLVR